MKQISPILHDIESFLAETGMSATYFGKRAVNNSELVDRLRAGGDVTIRTADRVRAFMADNSPTSEAPHAEGRA